MQSDSQTTSASTKLVWGGRVVSVLVVLGLVFSGVMKLIKPTGLPEEFTRLGWPPSLASALGVLELTCAVLYAIPQTAVLGAVLATGYLGGAIATHVRIEEGFAPPLIMGVLVWLGIYLRDQRLRGLLPLRSLPVR
jgi:hypothetical protein